MLKPLYRIKPVKRLFLSYRLTHSHTTPQRRNEIQIPPHLEQADDVDRNSGEPTDQDIVHYCKCMFISRLCEDSVDRFLKFNQMR